MKRRADAPQMPKATPRLVIFHADCFFFPGCLTTGDSGKSRKVHERDRPRRQDPRIFCISSHDDSVLSKAASPSVQTIDDSGASSTVQRIKVDMRAVGQ